MIIQVWWGSKFYNPNDYKSGKNCKIKKDRNPLRYIRFQINVTTYIREWHGMEYYAKLLKIIVINNLLFYID
jgi:hypothetical protein